MKTIQQVVPDRRKINITDSRYEITTEMDLSEKNIQSRSTIAYDLDVKYIGGGLFKQWSKSNLRINGKSTYGKMDEVYLKVSEPVNNLDFFYKNGAITELMNYKAILKEWETTKQNLQSEFYGEVINEVVSEVTKNYNDLELLKRMLSRDLVLQNLYSSTELNDALIYFNSSQEKRTYLGILDDIPLTFVEDKTLSHLDTEFKLKTESHFSLDETIQHKLVRYFQSRVDDFEINAFHASIKSKILFDQRSLWITNAQLEYDVSVDNSDYKKTITLTIKRK